MKKVRAKFACDSIMHNERAGDKGINFSAVVSGSPENESFSKLTPNGSLFLVIDNETPASDFFEEGEEYYVDIIPSNNEPINREDNYQTRLLQEKTDLEVKLNKLDDFLMTNKTRFLNEDQLALLKVQAAAMNTYLQILKERIQKL